MPEYRSCEFCRGERPLYAKQPCPPYHLQLWIRDGRLELDGILGSRVHNKNFLAPISISCRIFFCPVCGAPVGEFTPSQVKQSCNLCEEGTDWVRVSAPANLYLYFSNSTLHLVADLGYYFRPAVNHFGDVEKMLCLQREEAAAIPTIIKPHTPIKSSFHKFQHSFFISKPVQSQTTVHLDRLCRRTKGSP